MRDDDLICFRHAAGTLQEPPLAATRIVPVMAQQPQQPAVVEVMARSYHDFYTTEGPRDTSDPARLLASYRFTEAAGGGERPTPSSLKERSLALSDRRPLAFLCLHRKAGGTNVEVRILHRLMRFYELPADAIDEGGVDICMGLLGDVRAAQIPVVEVDNTIFSLVGGAVRVPTLAVMPDHLATAPPGSFLGPYGVDTPGTELVRPRMTQVLPLKYAAALVHRDGVSPAMAYQELQGMLEADGTQATCTDVLTWLRVACTARGGAGDLAGIPAVAQDFPLLLLPTVISDYVASKVAGDLPGRSTAGDRQRSKSVV